jgi:hypothetical protein
MKLLVILTILFTLSIKSDRAIIGYDFSKPLFHDVLPASLQEISGLTIIDSTTIACIQDENGILFLYDIKNHKIKQHYTFGLNGDYEGVTIVGKFLYVLRSDGILFEIKDYASKKIQVKTYATHVPAVNNEGLCYDSINNRLLIGAKGKINKDPANKDHRYIYEFNLSTKSLNQTPAYSFNIFDVNLFAKLNGVELRKRKTKNGKVVEVGLKFNTSEIAIHPITKQLYVLSANDHCLFIYNTNGNLEHIEQLSHSLFNKAEGLSFYPNGDALISNEGQAHQPTLLKFNYIP